MSKYYFQTEDSELCFPAEYFREQMRDTNTKEMNVFAAKVERIPGMFYCKHFHEVGQTGVCGEICEGYKPRNGKNGICKHFGNLYSVVGEVVLKLKKRTKT